MNQLDKLTPGNFRQGFEKPGTFQVAILQGPITVAEISCFLTPLRSYASLSQVPCAKSGLFGQRPKAGEDRGEFEIVERVRPICHVVS